MWGYHSGKGLVFFDSKALLAENLWARVWTSATKNEEQHFAKSFPRIGVFVRIMIPGHESLQD